MKKSLFVSIVIWTFSAMAFALGMCMVLLPEWNCFKDGIALSSIGILVALITLFLYERSIGKVFHRPNKKAILTIVIAVIGVLSFGSGMCFSMVWNNIGLGIFLGLIGILVLLSLIPLTRGVKD